MKAIIYEEFQGALTLQNVPDPAPEKDGVVIQLQSSGLCLSDWHGWMGHDKDIKLPHVPGHELAGIVVEIGSAIKNFKKGDRVTVPFVSGCGHCPECATGNQQICDNQFQPGFTHWGSFAEFVSIHYADINLVKLPEEVAFVTAASLGCRFATSFRGVVDQGRVKPEEWVAVHGCGGVGLSAIMIAAAFGAQVIAIDINQDKLDLAKSVGASATINVATSKDVIDAIREITGGGAHLSIDALGHPDVLFNSVSCLRKRGRHVQIGIMNAEHNNSKIPIDLIIGKELEIVGSHGMQAHRYNEMLEMIKSGKLHPEKLVANTISLSEVIDKLPVMHQSKTSGIEVITDFD
ncbi:zinc-dependent alcohol dehydrogenase family protein [Fulvivirga sp.]|uniref:zinc-dependent alcohol dehydrogenase family protein n=1 Tax=Fulvivirga sp. TaxID=1931237 RepID=UPI0032EB014A